MTNAVGVNQVTELLIEVLTLRILWDYANTIIRLNPP